VAWHRRGSPRHVAFEGLRLSSRGSDRYLRGVLRRALRPLVMSSALALLATLPSAASAVERPGWLGVAMDETTTGVRVAHVVRGSPAAQAGLERGGSARLDRRGTRERRRRGGPRGLSSHTAQSVVPIVVVRADKRLTLRAELRENPGSENVTRMEHVGAQAPPFDGAIPIGAAPKTIASLRGRVVLVDFWASWCGPCRMIAPRLSALQDKLGAQGLRVVGITSDPVEKGRDVRRARGPQVPHAGRPGLVRVPRVPRERDPLALRHRSARRRARRDGGPSILRATPSSRRWSRRSSPSPILGSHPRRRKLPRKLRSGRRHEGARSCSE
jgi:thiol-disulfide isomerase/thioredoxin